MKVLAIGATGNIGRVAAAALEEQGHEVLRASRSSERSVDLADTASIAALFAAVTANGAIESYVTTAATEAPRGIRLNVVSPDVLENSPHYHATFPGHRPVTDAEVGRAFVRAVDGVESGRTFAV